MSQKGMVLEFSSAHCGEWRFPGPLEALPALPPAGSQAQALRNDQRPGNFCVSLISRPARQAGPAPRLLGWRPRTPLQSSRTKAPGGLQQAG